MTQTIHLVPISEINTDDAVAHRKEISGIEELASSIKKLRAFNPISMGLLHPITLTEDKKLLAGLRRLEAFKSMGDTVIPAQFFNELSLADQRLVQLDENLRRVDITWQARAKAVSELHKLLNSDTATQTAEYIGLTVKYVSQYLQIAQELDKGDVKIAACESASQAMAIVDRRRAQAMDTELSKLHEDIIKPLAKTASTENGPAPRAPVPPIAQYSIIHENFLTWAPLYDGPKFNFIHCDFPYGIDAQDSASMGAAQNDAQYEDTPEIFFDLLHCLTENIDSLMYNSGHMLFWFHMKYYQRLIDHFQANGFFVVELPIIWHKSDGAGVASDYRRRPKHVYETAFWLSRGDRFISNVVNDVYACPTARNTEGHMSAKPLAMLKHFFNIAVNELSSVLDPTCGSGTSIRAAAGLGAERALGLELNQDIVPGAQKKLKEFLQLESASRALKEKATPLSITEL